MVINITLYKKIFKLTKFYNVSDHWKEVISKMYAKKLLISSIKIFVIIVISIFFLFIVNLFIANFIEFLLELKTLIKILIIMSIHLFVRRKIIEKL